MSAIVSAIASKWYPAQSTTTKKSKKASAASKVRASLVPGAVLIILAGRFRGKRVVLLKTFEDGTLLVTGPFKVNGVPLRRVNHRYVIATSTKVNVSGVDSSKFTPAYFSRDRKSEKKVSEEELFGSAKSAKKEIKSERVSDQKDVDSAILAEIKKTPLLKQYLAASFSLKHGDRPHLLKF